MDYKTVTNCRICGSDWLIEYLDLGNLPLANRLINEPEVVPTYPLKLMLCMGCKLTQLSIVVDPKALYTDYPYESSVSGTFKKHCSDLAKSLKSQFTFKNNPPTVFDIAANDGCLLNEFRKEGFVVRGCEPCERLATKCMLEHLIPIQNNFWSDTTARTARSWSGEDVITATNVFAHVDDVHSFLRGVNYHFEYNRKGILVIEVPYLLDLINNNQFDTIYHEHLSYFLLTPLMSLMASHGLRVFKAERIPIHGGSLRVYASQHEYEMDGSIKDILTEEAYVNTCGTAYELPDYYKDVKHKFTIVKRTLWETIESLSKRGDIIYSYGASAKGCMLLNFCDIDASQVIKCVDETVGKIGKYVPGANIPIVSFQHFDDKPDYILLTAWNFKSEMMAKTKHVGAKYIVPIPQVEIV